MKFSSSEKGFHLHKRRLFFFNRSCRCWWYTMNFLHVFRKASWECKTMITNLAFVRFLVIPKMSHVVSFPVSLELWSFFVAHLTDNNQFGIGILKAFDNFHGVCGMTVWFSLTWRRQLSLLKQDKEFKCLGNNMEWKEPWHSTLPTWDFMTQRKTKHKESIEWLVVKHYKNCSIFIKEGSSFLTAADEDVAPPCAFSICLAR